MGEKRLIGTPAEAVSLAMAAEAEMEYVPASVRNLLRSKPLHLTRFSIEVTPPDKYIGGPIGLVPAVEIVHSAVQAAELASQGGAAVTVRVSIRMGAVEIDGLGYESTSTKVNAAVVRSALERAVNSIVIRVPRPQ